MNRTCKICKQKKLLVEFYPHKHGTDGYLYQCRTCVRKRDRERGLTSARKAAGKARYIKLMSTAEGRERESLNKKRWAERNIIKRACHVIAGNAIAQGKLKWKPCERCGSEDGIDAHHEDYSKPLDVIWLCKYCHGERHREINEKRRHSDD